MTAGTSYKIEATFHENGGGETVRFYWDDTVEGTYAFVPDSAFTKDAVVPPPAPLNAPTNLRVAQLGDGTVELLWDQPEATSTTVERYAVSWSTPDGGWGVATPGKYENIYLNRQLFSTTGGLDKTYTFTIRADNDTLGIYSPTSTVVELLVSSVVQPPISGNFVSVNEGQTLQATAPDGKLFDQAIAWYGSPDWTCGLFVSQQVTTAFTGKATSSIDALNDNFTDPCPGTGKVLIAQFTYKDAPVVVIPTPSPSPLPIPTQEPNPVVPPQEPVEVPVETPVIIEPTPIPTEEPVVEPTPLPSQEESAPTPSPSQEPIEEPTENVIPKTPEPEQAETPKPTEPELPINLETVNPETLTDKEIEELVVAAEAILAGAEQGSPEYEQALEALSVAAQADDPELPAELAAIPGAAAVLEAFNDLGNIGADMAPAVREEAEKTVIAAVIATGAAVNATVAAATAAASTGSTGSSGGGASGGSSSGSGSSRRR